MINEEKQLSLTFLVLRFLDTFHEKIIKSSTIIATLIIKLFIYLTQLINTINYVRQI